MFDPATFLPSPRQSTSQLRPFLSYHNVRWDDAPLPPTGPRRGAKRAGILYEQRVADILTAIYGTAFRRSPSISYRWKGGAPRRAILDGLLTLPDCTIIVEVKLAHTAAVWEQLMERYLPLVTQLVDGPTRPVEICRSYDPAIPLPGRHALIDSLHRPPSCEGTLEVLPWRI